MEITIIIYNEDHATVFKNSQPMKAIKGFCSNNVEDIYVNSGEYEGVRNIKACVQDYLKNNKDEIKSYSVFEQVSIKPFKL